MLMSVEKKERKFEILMNSQAAAAAAALTATLALIHYSCNV
jgi:hypothetical protein